MMPVNDAPGGLPLRGAYPMRHYRTDDITMRLADKRFGSLAASALTRNALLPKHRGQSWLEDEQSNARD